MHPEPHCASVVQIIAQLRFGRHSAPSSQSTSLQQLVLGMHCLPHFLLPP